MVHTFIGKQDYIEEELRKLKKNFHSENIISYDLEKEEFQKVIDELNIINMFGKKLIIVFNIDKLEKDDGLIKYLETKNENDLVLISYKELDKRKKLTKILKQKTKYTDLFNCDLSKLIKENLDNYQMSNMSINILISYCDSNLKRILNELEKLKIYKINDKVITNNDIEEIIKKGYDSTIFNLIDAINLNDKHKAYKIYKELLQENETEEKILYTIANHYRLLLQIKIKSKSESDNHIITEYKMHPYRLTKLKQQGDLVSNDKILKILKTLSDIDIDIKKGKKTIATGMCLFFENL